MKKTNKNETLEEQAAIVRILDSEDGALLLRYLGKCCLHSLGVRCKDPVEYAYNEGARSILLALLQFAAVDPTFFVQDMINAKDKQWKTKI